MNAIIIIFIGGVLALYFGLFNSRNLVQPTVLLTLVLALAANILQWGNPPSALEAVSSNMFLIDNFALGFSSLCIGATLLIALLGNFAFKEQIDSIAEYYALMLFSLCGAICMCAYTNLIMLFLGIEILSIPIYVLAGSKRESLASNEAALKYFITGAFASAILLFGTALIYGATGTFDITKIVSSESKNASLFFPGLLMILSGLCFKISAAPFHFWSPDVYQGSPSLITTFMATVVKTSAFAAFYKLFSYAFVAVYNDWAFILSIIAAFTMIIGNVTALFQVDFKRMMAYSSISHAGYLLLAILGMQSVSSGTGLLYLSAYSLATIGAFSIFIFLSNEQGGSESLSIFTGLKDRHPIMAAVMAICLLSLAGIPPTAGFFGKYFLFVQAFSDYKWLIIIAIITSAISLYYYFKIIIFMYFHEDKETLPTQIPTFGYQLVMGICALLVLLICIFPDRIIGLL